MSYSNIIATSDLQVDGNALLNQILAALQALPGASAESAELQAINNVAAVVSTATGQSTANATLASILAAFGPLATASGQAAAGASLASILTALGPAATAANQAAANASLASILAAMATAAKQDTGNTTLAAIDSKMKSTTAVLSKVTQSTSTQVMLPANANRKGFQFYNNAGAYCYVAYAATATATAFTMKIAPNTGVESQSGAIYTGPISVIWVSGSSGDMQITELV